MPPNRAIALFFLLLFTAGAALATPPISPREQHEALIASGQLEAGRTGFRKEIAQVREMLDAAEGEPGVEGLGKRATYLNELNGQVVSWAGAEAKALYAKKATAAGQVLDILDGELLPLARRIRDRRASYLLEADRLETSLAPADRPSRGWAFDAVRWPDDTLAELPLSLARLAKVAGSRDHVERVFTAFGGKVGRFTSAAEYYSAPEDYGRTIRLGVERRGAPAAEAVAPTLGAETEAAVRELLGRYYAALSGRDRRGVRECMVAGSPQVRTVRRRMRRSPVVAIGEVGRVSLQPQPDGAVKATVEDVPITVREAGADVTRKGAQVFVVVQTGGQWKIREVGR